MREKGTPCPKCKQVEVCAQCKSDIVLAVWRRNVDAEYEDLWFEIMEEERQERGRDWWGE